MGELSLRRRLALELWRIEERRAAQEHKLQQLFWECTLRCNLHCRHCGSDCKQEATQQDMPLADFLGVLDNIAAHTDPHKVFVIITGGEPLMRPDLEACGRAIYDKGFPWGMVTNGLAMSEARFRRLLAAGMHTATVSLDGLEEDHYFMRGHNHSYERAVAAISMMAQTPDFLFDVVTCCNRRNIDRLDEVKELLIGLGVKRWRIFTVFPVGRAATDPDLQLTNEEFRRLMEYIQKTRKEGRIRVDYGCEGFLGRYEGEVRNRFFGCRAGISVGSVLADGSISACASIRADYHQGNIYQDDFWEVWQTRFEKFRNRAWMRTDQCADCSFFRYCQGSGMHLRDGEGKLLFCHLQRIQK
ncbi:MAG: TIGR04133 family radical SAM/SPASM protein [Alistipes sp.]|nr:TIGR04133 family radical SAM/SPASM protein [Alistipes sp.]